MNIFDFFDEFGNLYLGGCTGLTSLPEGLTVGGYLYLGGCTGLDKSETPKVRKPEFPLRWENKNGEFMLADGIFSKVLQKKSGVYKCEKLRGGSPFYIVSDGAGKFAHGSTIKEAKADLIYKISNRDTTRYAHLTMESTLTLEEAIEAYRVISGACSAGTRMFVESLPATKSEYTIREIVELTVGQYGHDAFKRFFEK